MAEEQENEDESECMDTFSDLSKKKLIWDGMVVLLAIFNSFAVPLEFVYKDLPKNSTY